MSAQVKSMEAIFDEKLAAIKGGPGSGPRPGHGSDSLTPEAIVKKMLAAHSRNREIGKNRIRTRHSANEIALRVLDKYAPSGDTRHKAYRLYQDSFDLAGGKKSFSFKALAEGIEDRVEELEAEK